MKKSTMLALIVGWSLVVHWPGITSPLLDYHAHRQCQTASMARNYYRHGMNFLKPETDTFGAPTWTGTEFPIYSYLVAILYKLFGLHEILGRLLSAALTAWSAVWLLGLVRRRLGDAVGLWSALIMCAIPVHIYFTRTFQPESMALWSLIGFIYYFDRWLNGEGTLKSLVAALLLGSIGPLLKLPFLYLVGGAWLVMGAEKRFVLRPKPAYWSIIPIVVAVTAAWYCYTRLAPAQVLPLGAGEHSQNLRVIFTWDFWQAHFISHFPEICTTYSGLVLGVIGGVQLIRRKDVFFAGWCLATVAYTVLLGQYGLIHKYTQIPWAPVNAVFIAVGLVAAWQWAAGRLDRRALVILLVVGIPLHAGLRIKHWYRLERLWLFRAHDVLDRVARPEDLVLTNTAETPVLLYYLDRSGYPVNLDEASIRDVDDLLRRVRFFLTPVEGSWSRRPQRASFIASRATLVQDDPEYRLYRVHD